MIKKNFKSINMMTWAKTLFTINRSITAEGLRKTIKFIKEKVNKKFKKKKIKILEKNKIIQEFI